MNRQDKIKLLKEIASGKTLIQDAIELQDLTKANIWFVGEGILTNVKTGEIVTKAEFEANNKNSLTITFE